MTCTKRLMLSILIMLSCSGVHAMFRSSLSLLAHGAQQLTLNRIAKGAAVAYLGFRFVPDHFKQKIYTWRGLNVIRQDNLYKGRELADATALVGAAFVGRSHCNWSAVRNMAVCCAAATNLLLRSIQQWCGDTPLLRKAIGSYESDYNYGILHRIGLLNIDYRR